MDLVARPCLDHVGMPECREVWYQALDACPGAGGELVRFGGPEFHQERAGLVVGGATDGHAGGELGVERADLGESGMRSGPESLVQPDDRRAEQGRLVREV